MPILRSGVLQVGKTSSREKQSKPPEFDQKNQEPPIGSSTKHFQ